MTLEKKAYSDYSLSKITALLLCCVLLLIGYSYFPSNILCWDVFGYYLYLPLTFIYHDLGLKDHTVIDAIIQKYHNTGSFYQAFQLPTGNWVMRYSIGMSILYFPFFFAAHLVAKIGGFPADGFSTPYQYAIWIGSMFFAFIGIFILRKSLLKFFEEKIVALLLIIIVLGTNYTLHTSVHGQGAMPHDYLFTLYACILWFTIRWHESQKMKYALWLALACGLAILSRPSEAVALFIPIFWGIYNQESLIKKIKIIKQNILQLLAFSVVLMAIGFVQFAYWKIYAGAWIFDSYYNPGEGLDLFPPHTINTLFSFRNGWLVYSPVMLFAILGFIFLYRKDKNIFTPLFGYFIINLWIVSSWTIWWCGPSFGQRYLIASYPALAIPLGYFFTVLFEKKKIVEQIFVILLALFVGLNLFQSWQMISGILPTPRMTQDGYVASFVETEVPLELERMLMIDPLAPGATEIDENEYEKTNEFTEDFENSPNAMKDSSVSKTSFIKLDSVSLYSPNLERRYSGSSNRDLAKMRISLLLYCTIDPRENPGSLVVTFEHEGLAYGYSAIDIEKQNITLNSWSKISFNYVTPTIRSEKDKLKVYYWHRGKKSVFIDDLKVEVWERND